MLQLTVEGAEEFFNAIPKIHRKMATLLDVGLGYINPDRSGRRPRSPAARRRE